MFSLPISPMRRSLLLAVSGGPDSTALLALAARWRARLTRGPQLIAVTIDHGLRPEARREAAAVKRLAQSFGMPHRTLRWTDAKPRTGIQEKARAGALRSPASRGAPPRAHATCVTAHTLDDQAETILFRMARGSGISGLAGMARATAASGRDGAGASVLATVPKARLLATLAAQASRYVDDPSNRDPRFARVAAAPADRAARARRGLMPTGSRCSPCACGAPTRRSRRSVDAAARFAAGQAGPRTAHRDRRGHFGHAAGRGGAAPHGPRHRPCGRRRAGRTRQARGLHGGAGGSRRRGARFAARSPGPWSRWRATGSWSSGAGPRRRKNRETA